MDKSAIRKYAVWARRELIEKVSQKAMQYGIEEGKPMDLSLESFNGVLLSDVEKKQRLALINRINEVGYKQVVEEVAYTWFNRFIALRFMEVNGYLPSHVRVFSDENNNFNPQILSEALHLEMDSIDKSKVLELKTNNQDEELYKYLLIAQCNDLYYVLPKMFQKISDYTELLLPNYLLREGSVVRELVVSIPEDDWRDQVQIIGWLYQYYNIEPKDEVFAALKKNIKIAKENIPAATQLFTPDWIVRYMVENSLGKLWVNSHPNCNLEKEWKYYLDDAKQIPAVVEQLESINGEYLNCNPENIRCIDPCMGSGHILVYLFDVLIQIYENYGYSARDAASKILQHNIIGLDIDSRASQLAYFAVMMKARQYDRRLFARKTEDGRNIGEAVNIYAIPDAIRQDDFFEDFFANGSSNIKCNYDKLNEAFKNGKDLGALIKPEGIDYKVLEGRINEIINGVSLHRDIVLSKMVPLINVAKILNAEYDVVVTNPPYMGNNGMNDVLTNFVKEHYPNEKTDLFAVFISRGNQLTSDGGYNCMVTMQSWMFLSSFEKMRNDLLSHNTITNLMHMDNMVMGIAFGTAVTAFRKRYIKNYRATYNHITIKDIVNDEPVEFPIKKNRFNQISAEELGEIPGKPISYWLTESIIDDFKQGTPLKKYGDTRQGMATSDNNRFLRLWFEVDYDKLGFDCRNADDAVSIQKKWYPYNKGGEYRKWYGNQDYVLNYENNGEEVKELARSKYKTASRTIKSESEYFKSCISWSKVSSGSIAFRYYPDGFIFDVAGCCIFYTDPVREMYDFGFLNSKVAKKILEAISPTINYEAGHIASLPIKYDSNKAEEIDSLVRENIQLSKEDWDSFETSWNFKMNPLIKSVDRICDAYQIWETECCNRFHKVKENEIRLNTIFAEIYNITQEEIEGVCDEDITIRLADRERDIRNLLSFFVGCEFGRYSLAEEGICIAGLLSHKKVGNIDDDNIIPITDDEYFSDDIVTVIEKYVKIVYGPEYLEENLKYIADSLTKKNNNSRDTIRQYFLNEFYDDHCAKYSVNGSGKRPIYWMFDAGKKNSFKCLCYMHRMQADTVARIRTDYIHELQSKYRTILEGKQNAEVKLDGTQKTKNRTEIEKMKGQQDELFKYEELIHHIADQMITIDLDDGFKVNYAKYKGLLTKV